MDISHKVAWLVSLFDLKTVGLSAPVPELLKSTKFLESTIEKYPTSFSVRVTNAALRLTYDEFKNAPKNSESTLVEFESKYLSTMEGFSHFQKNILEVSKKLRQQVSAREYLEFLNQD